MHIKIPKLSLVVLIGPSGSGKSTFARKHFLPTEVLSSDFCRGLVSDDENDQTATNDAFEVLHFVAAKRLARGHLTVVDATNVQPEARRPLVQLAKKHHCLPVAIVLNPPEKVCHERNRDRDDRMFGPHVVRQQRSQLRRSLKALKREGFRHIFVMDSIDELTALRYPEKEFVSVPAKQTYCEPARPFLADDQQAPLSAQQLHDCLLDAEDVLGKRLISTRLQHNVTIREENATAALEVMSRFAANPKWLIYLPPTMSPCETSNEPGLLEHPAEAFSYFRSQGVPQVVCEEKHMGSRAVVVVCRDEDAARERFGVTEGETGIVYTRTGRRFFNDAELESQFLDRLCTAMSASGFWEEFQTSWACLDCELMPWSAKAQELLRSQYAAVGAAGSASLPEAIGVLERTAWRMNGDNRSKTSAVLDRLRGRRHSIEQFVTAYRHYCWTVESLSDLKLAPFHLLATEGKVHTDQNHVWHMETLATVCQQDPDVLLATAFKVIDLTDLGSISTGIDWWTSLTGSGGEGMVVKPADWIVRGKKGLVQPAVKCRGKEYLRIIYSPDYDAEENLPRLRNRSLGRKRSLALREFALGLEALERFVRREPLRRVHECVFGVLALESEPVDPRL